MTTAPLIADGRPALAFAVRPTEPGDLPFVAETWHRTAHLESRHKERRHRKHMHVAIDALLERPDVFAIAAYDDTREHPIVGWMAWSSGRLPVVHFVYTRFGDRQHGVATALLRSPLAALGGRLMYTFRGVRQKGGDCKDVVLAASLARRGVASAFVPVREYLGTVTP